jgi:uncharacterized membrane protein
MSGDRESPSYLPRQARPAGSSSYEDVPIARQEYIAAMVHLYRGELQRSLEWRRRMDTTTHWALITTVGIVTFGFSNPAYAHETLIVGMFANLMYLIHESRRFRFFDMSRARLRMIEENFYGPILRRDPASPIEDWGEQVATDLLHPKYKITRRQALRARLRRNYSYLFVFLLVTFFGRSLLLPVAEGQDTLQGLFSIGPIPWWAPVALVVGLYSYLIWLLAFTPPVKPAETAFWRDPANLGEDVPNLDV